ncbi:hypothetical protein [Peribacillus sp. NPDC097295]|uniref:hypothetical protein n=1 Tax=Peribacillus sp. NPDC097295 TaxID=3364402 RepID=UPI0037FEDF01
MAYKVKRGTRPADHTIKEMLFRFMKRLLFVLVILIIMFGVGYFLFQFAYDEFPVFASAADDVIMLVKGFYGKHGFWATIGVIGFISLAVWALGEESRRKERRRETMDDMMK